MYDNQLERRAAFWDYFRRDYLLAAIQELDKRRADKWLDDKDLAAFCSIQEALDDALLSSMLRYHQVLGEQIKVMQEDN